MINKLEDPIIIDDVVFVDYDIATDNAKSCAKESYVYIDRFEGKEDNSYEQFLCINDIYTYMFNRGYLNGKSYNLMYSLEDNMCYFTLNLDELLEVVDLEKELRSEFKDEKYDKCISMLLNPPKTSQCACCGANRLLMNDTLEKDTGYGKKGRALCPHCNALPGDYRYDISSRFFEGGTYYGTIIKASYYNNDNAVDNDACKLPQDDIDLIFG